MKLDFSPTPSMKGFPFSVICFSFLFFTLYPSLSLSHWIHPSPLERKQHTCALFSPTYPFLSLTNLSLFLSFRLLLLLSNFSYSPLSLFFFSSFMSFLFCTNTLPFFFSETPSLCRIQRFFFFFCFTLLKVKSELFTRISLFTSTTFYCNFLSFSSCLINFSSCLCSSS
ncbi:unnamed protein product [Acanthosepion pharaonis]|uniref:Uncharacterized protein n=1 Tax=Acanthosepion pharaonis TaxID=158019 RepID=A0A812D810_ACAPH|nr:unnamed protein product [Sepia pharaonis]